MIMNAKEKTALLTTTMLRLKRATQLAESILSDGKHRLESASTLEQLSTEAHASVCAYRSTCAGNEEPKIG